MREITFITLGWLFGLLSPAITNEIKNRREANALKTALLTELHELQYRLVLMVFRIESKYGQLNHDFFKWAQGVLIDYKGVNSSEVLLNTIGPLLKLTGEEMKTYVEYAKQGDQLKSALSIKKYSLPLLESSFASLSQLNPILRGRLLEIKNHIGFMNEIVDDARYYFKLSFQNGISQDNYAIANANMIDSYKTYSSQARVVVSIVTKIIAENKSSDRFLFIKNLIKLDA